MDDTDRKLLIMMAANPRTNFQELAKALRISRQAVHHRIQVLTDIGVIKGTIASISIPYLDAVPVVVFGRSKAASIDENLDRLGENESSCLAAVAGGNFVYVEGFLRDISELDSFAEFVRRTAEMSEPTVGIARFDEGLAPPYSVDGGKGKRNQRYKELSPLDLKIIASLKDNARRPVTEIAEMVEVTPKTVRRHLEDMISEGSLCISAPMDLPSGGDLFLIMHVNLRDSADKGEVGRRLMSKHYFQDQYIRTFSNLPGFLMWVFWSDQMTEIRKALKETSQDEYVQSVMLNFAYLERIYATWRDRLPAVQTRPHREPKTRKPHSGLRTQQP
ncbi:MAG TPA: winged helix-turn-helix transcriptional regulator [Thermoplasmata archaeon]|jgi:DNA-binding Lrp family transcriptional regulator